MAAEPSAATVTLTLLSRPDCPLCEEFADALAGWRQDRPTVTVEAVDITGDAELEARYGWIIPVLLAGERQLCAGHFDADALRAVLT